jgi:N-acetylglucosaminyldiphosphoundecaprenol N-acetyl-beta-D-mannosaminyltransferase
MGPANEAPCYRASKVRRIRIGSVWIDALTFEGALQAVERLIAAGHGGALFTPNVDHIVTADSHADLREAYAAADLSLADGQWVVWASQLLGTPLPAKISGSDLILPLAREAGRTGRSIFLLGGAPGVAEAAAHRLEKEGAIVCGWESPQIDLAAPQDELVARIAAVKPALILVALGCPRQEIWIHRHRERLRPAVLLGVGGTLDFITGRIRRAPGWISKAGLEWAFRLLLEPRRLARRYLVNDPWFLGILLRTLLEPRERRLLDS